MEFLIFICAAVGGPLSVLLLAAHGAPVTTPNWPLIGLFVASLVFMTFVVMKGIEWIRRLQRAITPVVVWNFFTIKDVSAHAVRAAENLTNAFTWFKR